MKKKKKAIGSKQRSDFTFKGYNDKLKKCPYKRCKGMVRPTWNANVGKCDKCSRQVRWAVLALVR